jgi:phage replication O-like protein O
MGSNRNRFAERLAHTRLSPREAQVYAPVARKTLGYRKPQGDRISASQIALLTGIPRQHVTETLARLEKRGLISSERRRSRPRRRSADHPRTCPGFGTP